MLNLFQHLSNKVQNSSILSISYKTLKQVQGDRTSLNECIYKKCAFTLAEVLITLVIIGVIAAITVPTLIVKYQKEQTIVRLKKAYSVLSQTTQKAIADNGPLNTWDYPTTITNDSAYNFFKKYMKPYLNIAKDCGNQTTGDCLFHYNRLSPDLGGYDVGTSSNRFYLNDGTFIAGQFYLSDTQKRYGVYVDINGQKGPNTFGKDIYELNYWLVNEDKRNIGRFVPNCMTHSNEALRNNCSRSSHGNCCAAVIMKNNWTMPDYYPW